VKGSNVSGYATLKTLLRVHENRVLRRIFDPKREKVVGS
jgi:hypothetical protein